MHRLRQRLANLPALNVPIGTLRLRFGLYWLALLPLLSWGLQSAVLPLAAPQLDQANLWITAIATTLIIMLALVAHALSHALAARMLHEPLPEIVPIELYGDPTQIWPAATTPTRDALIALAGPLTSALLAFLAALLWNAQLGPAINAITFLATILNAAVAILNLAPGIPFDGGRILRALAWGLLNLPQQAALIAGAAGAVLALDLGLWGLYLISLNARFSLETGSGAVLVALLMLTGQRHAAWGWLTPPTAIATNWRKRSLAGIVVLAMLSVILLLTPLVDGLYAPGPAVTVGPMIRVPAERNTTSKGELMLTTVVSQTPITLGQWIFAQVNPAFTIVPPEQIVPVNTTPQQIMRQNVSMLEESEASAIVAGVRLAGYQADLTSTSLQVTAVAPESPANSKIQAGDLIIAVAGIPTPRLDLLRTELAKHATGEQIDVELERNTTRLHIQTALMPPGQPGGPPRIGVTLQPLGLDVQLPFPVSIKTEKIAGGPSAGLMFTLAVYDALAPEDLTHGWRIAGTGTIALDGTVGPIGGIAQKIAGAEWAGADYFIVPREHEQEARQVAQHLKLIPVSTVQEALAALQALPQRPTP